MALRELLRAKVDEDAPKVFRYSAVSMAGVRVKSTMLAMTPMAVAEALQADGFIPLQVVATSSKGLNVDLGVLLGGTQPRLKTLAVSALTRQLHHLLDAGLSVPKALQATAEDAPPKVAAMLNDIATKVSNGIPLADAFRTYPKTFDQVFLAYLEAGELTGELVATTGLLAALLEKQAQMILKIKGVTAYPKIMSITIGILVTGILLFMVPMYERIYAGFGAQLPAATQFLVNLSRSIVPIEYHSFGTGFPMELLGFPYPNFASPTLWGGVIFVAAKIWLHKTRNNLEIGHRLDQIRYRLPLFGKLQMKLSLFRWASTMSGALSSGMQLQPALSLAAGTSGSRWQAWVLQDLQEAVGNGRQLSEVMQAHKDLYPPNLRAMIRTGEDAGELSSLLFSVSKTFNDEIDSIIAGLGAKIETALILVMGAVVGGMLAALYLPILNLALTAGTGLSHGSF